MLSYRRAAIGAAISAVIAAVVGPTGAITATAEASGSGPRVGVSVPANATEGARFSVTVKLRQADRFSVFGQNTSTPAGGSTPNAYPAVGDPELLCHQG